MACSAAAQPAATIPSFVNKLSSLAIPESEDNADIRQKYRPFLLTDDAAEDWVNTLELTTAMKMAAQEMRKSNNRIKVLVLYGSLRRRSYSRLVALEASRILFRLGCDVRVFNPEGLPVKNDTDHDHPKVQELRELSKWSDGHIWVSPEQHGNLVGVTLPSGNRDRLVDCMEEFVKYTIVMRSHLELFGDRFSEREEKRNKEIKERAKQV
ncbi:flavo protein-like protein [Aspergillus welwitschiae]|uniref:Flavo protein-like protein n=1 Tax=Aspergillus welwitschiae TaxID=1341132 RepID=A0A3F3QA74_9EURO|nr:flavo protein-like protein [Aspergillus welwitschiae]RDH36015.1 flavo protein-like protein [Aspergillus welwitschiae]